MDNWAWSTDILIFYSLAYICTIFVFYFDPALLEEISRP